jgi:hypothetical protein
MFTYLWDSVASQDLLGHIEFLFEATTQRKVRKVCHTLYAQRVTLPKKKGKQALEVTIILAREENPPAGETPILWRLLKQKK